MGAMADGAAGRSVVAAPKPATLMGGKLCILAGGGRLPLDVADSARQRGIDVHIAGITGAADETITRYPHTWVNFGQIGRMLHVIESEGDRRVVIAGAVRRPVLKELRPDLGLVRALPAALRLVTAGGDDALLTRCIRFFEGHGITVHGIEAVAPELLFNDGVLGVEAEADAVTNDATIGFGVIQALAPFDVGQAVAVRDRKVVAIEGVEGTDAMLERVAGHQSRPANGNGATHRHGVLVKAPKPGQELRVDRPTIGPRTIGYVSAAGLGAIVVPPSAVIVLDRGETATTARAHEIAVVALAPEPVPLPPVVRATLLGEVRARSLGRVGCGRHTTRDAKRASDIVVALSPFATGGAAIVVRAHVLAVETGEGAAVALKRAASLRQWGLGRLERRRGVLAVRVRDAATTATLADLIADAGKFGIAAFIVVHGAHMTFDLDALIASADRAGIALLQRLVSADALAPRRADIDPDE